MKLRANDMARGHGTGPVIGWESMVTMHMGESSKG